MTPALLLLLGCTVVRSIASRLQAPSSWTLDDWVLTLPPVIYFASAMASGMNIGHRHLAPIYPFIFLAAGRTAEALVQARGRTRAFVLILLAGHAVSSISAHPGYLSYFNMVAGGTRGGHRYLLDSNIDWGQDLLRLGRLMKAQGISEVHLLACHENGEPQAYGVQYRHRLEVYRTRPLPPGFLPGPGETVAVSLSILHGLYVESPEIRVFLTTLRTMTPIAYAGDSIFLYRMPHDRRP